ncbi:MAG TPA: type II toxin-antitoxin system prevent-host-death family antitoxin [Burkholderiales bacterium]|nr:type II toxin-antitoxin system prevent-host-death family antitoxin [Burkholderiales bacterium]
MKTMTSVEAQNRFGELLDTAQREPVTITRRGRTVAFLLSPADMKNLMDARSKRDEAVKAFQAYSARVAKKATAVAKKLTDEDVTKLVNELR